MRVLCKILAVIVCCVVGAVWSPTVAWLLALMFVFFFKRFLEVVLVGLFLDALYAAPEPRWFEFQFIYTATALAGVLVIEILKKRIRFYN